MLWKNLRIGYTKDESLVAGGDAKLTPLLKKIKNRIAIMPVMTSDALCAALSLPFFLSMWTEIDTNAAALAVQRF